MKFQSANIRRLVGCMALFLLLCAPAFFPASASTGNTFVIRHARVFDGHKTLTNTDVWVEDGKIKAVGKDLKVPTEVKAIDATGDTLLPGLIDSHTHAWGDALKEAEIRRHHGTRHVHRRQVHAADKEAASGGQRPRPG